MRFTLPLFVIVFILSNSNLIIAQFEATGKGCKEEGYKQASFQEYFIYTELSESAFTEEVSVMESAPLK